VKGARQAIVVGGGVGALAAAIALRRAGVAAEVFEQAPALRAAGGGLLLWTNAMRALRLLDLERAVLRIGAPVERTEFRTDRGRLLTTLPIGDLSHSLGAPSVLVPRGPLLEVLTSVLPPEAIHVGARCTGIERDDAHGAVVARFADGSTRPADVLIGADGLRSTIRAHLRGAEPLRGTGQAAFVGLSAGRAAAMEPGTAVATVGSGRRFWAGPLREGLVYWYATVRDSDGVSPEPETAREQLLALFAGWHRPIEALIDATTDGELIRTVIADREPVDRWGRGRVTLLGDAAHPCTPDLGQGACQALESAVVLGECLAEGADAEVALRRYEELRMRRTARVTQLSWVTAMQSMVEGPIACAARDLGVSTLLARMAMPELRWMLSSEGRRREGAPSYRRTSRR
jgi:2-polyprenyl-6-methoxyphenol hydroxylase-like FAD-dependent oxidoreductase